MQKLDWHVLWMTMAFTVSQKSIDKDTKHGCIIVDNNNKLISMGYNSFPRDCLDNQLPLTRPEKYSIIIHSETNAIINANKNDLHGTTAYITGCPCTNCFANMLNAGINRVIYGPIGSYMLKKEDIELIQLMNISKKTGQIKIKIIKFEDIRSIDNIYSLIDQTKKYIQKRSQELTENG